MEVPKDQQSQFGMFPNTTISPLHEKSSAATHLHVSSTTQQVRCGQLDMYYHLDFYYSW